MIPALAPRPGQDPLTRPEMYELARRIVSAVRHTADECGTLRHRPPLILSTYGLPGNAWECWDETAAELSGLLTDDLLSPAAPSALAAPPAVPALAGARS